MGRAVIVADDGFGRQAAANLLAGSELEVVASTGPGEEVGSVLGRWRPDVVLVDLAQSSGLVGVLDAVRAAGPGAAAVVLVDADDLDRVVPIFEHGARGLLSRHRSSAELLEGLRTVADGQIVVDPRLAAPLAEFVTRGVRVAGPYGLSRTEELVVAHLPAELTNQQIGRRIGIAEPTVRTHLRNAFRKLGVAGRDEAALFALERGLA